MPPARSSSGRPADDLPQLAFGAEILRDFPLAASREWLVANGTGSYACGTVAGVATRRYHGLLVAALEPPLGRMVTLAELDETLILPEGRSVPLSCHEFQDGTVHPRGHEHAVEFRLDGRVPTWTFAFGDTCVERRLLMVHGQDTTLVTWRLTGPSPARLRVTPLVAWRDFHSQRRGPSGGWSCDVERPSKVGPQTIRLRLAEDVRSASRPLSLAMTGATFLEEAAWWWGFRHRVEEARGLDAVEDLFAPGAFESTLAPGTDVTLAATLEADAAGAALAFARAEVDERERERSLLARSPVASTPLGSQLTLAADQFVAARGASGRTILAGFPWFGDWGRDTMISVPGLLLATGRAAEAEEILRTYAGFVTDGLVPNRFPEAGTDPELNTVDASLWYVAAVARCADALPSAGGSRLAKDLLPTLQAIVQAFRAGTRHGIGVAKDGLLAAGEPGVALTWMDARVDGTPVTPRHGKPVEINALWHHALRATAGLAARARRAGVASEHEAEAERVAGAFVRRFWSEATSALFDVVDSPSGDDASLRPNQVIALALPDCPLQEPRQRRALATVGRLLLAPCGLRTLAPADVRYVPRYEGGVSQRDGAYHQGTAWPWLFGPWALAHLRLGGDPDVLTPHLAAFEHHLRDAGLGTISEILDADPPHVPRGCFAQAWSVAAVLEVLHALAARGRPWRGRGAT